MGIFDLFKKKKPELQPFDLSVLKTDVHSHLIPGIDDGSKNMEDTLYMLSVFQALGYQKVITTPHIMIDHYKNTPDIILGGLEDVRKALLRENMNIQIEAAAEYYLDEYFLSIIQKKEVLTFGKNHVLFELSFNNESPYLPEAVFQMQMAGYKPILAHVERYYYWHEKKDKYHEWFDKEVLFQLNINSLTGHYGPEVRKACEYLIDHNMYHFVGSDCHHIHHLELIEMARKDEYLHKVLNSNKLLNATL
jgi:protein-tyrosine phosphatase